jgi:hypothetical protein
LEIAIYYRLAAHLRANPFDCSSRAPPASRTYRPKKHKFSIAIADQLLYSGAKAAAYRKA